MKKTIIYPPGAWTLLARQWERALRSENKIPQHHLGLPTGRTTPRRVGTPPEPGPDADRHHPPPHPGVPRRADRPHLRRQRPHQLPGATDLLEVDGARRRSRALPDGQDQATTGAREASPLVGDDDVKSLLDVCGGPRVHLPPRHRHHPDPVRHRRPPLRGRRPPHRRPRRGCRRHPRHGQGPPCPSDPVRPENRPSAHSLPSLTRNPQARQQHALVAGHSGTAGR